MIQYIKPPTINEKPIQPVMLIFTIGFWVLLNNYFSDKYLNFIHVQLDWVGTVVAVVTILWILLTSFYAIFHLMSLLFSLMVRELCKEAERDFRTTPPVAILYTCMNDMKETAIYACLSQDYPSYALYILDDSTNIAERDRVDSLKAIHGKKISILRRAKRNGYKAGNLNNALREIGDQYKYICVVDADELIPPIFLREMVSIAEGNEHLGFVQASHRQYSETNYGKQTGEAIDLHWSYFLPARNLFGFVYSYGHGVLIRYQALINIGGFPEVVSEDVALSTKLREVGYRGYYAFNIESFEETPPSYEAFRRRNKKVVSGTLEFLFSVFPSFLRAANVSLVEKIDLVLALSVIYLHIPFMLFLFIIYGLPHLTIGNLNAQHHQSMVQMFDSLQSWDFILCVFFTIFAPLCYLLRSGIHAPKKTALYILRMGTIYLSLCLHTFGATLKWFITRQTPFTPTGDRIPQLSISGSEYVECLLGLSMIIFGIIIGSLCLVAVGLSLALVPIMIKRNLDGNLTSLLSLLPVLITVIAILGAPMLIIGATGMFAGIALSHH